MIHQMRLFVDSEEAVNEGSEADDIYTLEFMFRGEVPLYKNLYVLSVHANQSPTELAQELRAFAQTLETGIAAVEH